MGARGERVRCTGVGGVELPALFVAAQPRWGARAPGVVLAPDVFGLDEQIENAAQRLAAEGFAVLAVDVASRELAPRHTPEQARSAALSLPDRRVLGDLDAALAWLEKRADVDARKLCAVGFGLGGNHAYLLGCTSRRVKAVVDINGPLQYGELTAARPMQPIEYALNLSVPLLALFGEQDASIPREHVASFRRSLDSAAKNFEIVTYPGAGSGFFDDTRPSHRPEATRDAWRRTLAFLREQLELDDDCS